MEDKVPAEPNILIIKSDQHNARCLGVNGHRQVQTPNLDNLARSGVNFSHAFVQNPICSPSRMSYLSGQYVHNHGVYGLTGNETLPPGLPSLFSVFRSHGYRTGVIGHIHVKEEWLKPHCDMYRDLHAEGNAYDAYLAAKGLSDLRDDESYRGISQTLDACPSALSFEDCYEGYCLQSFHEFLDDLPAGQPFLYQIDCVHPHQNYIPVEEFWELYGGVELELPPSADEDSRGKPSFQRQMQEWCRNRYPWLFEPKTYEAGRLRKLRGYYGCISQVDHMVGLARRKLRELGHEENTIVVYCADHGDFALEHGFLEKAPGISYDAILRTPFIWCWPGGGFPSAPVEELVESVDLFPTLCGLAAIDPPDTVDGLDLSPMLRGDRRPVREFVVAEFPLSRTIRTREWKLCHRPLDMYEEGEDPGEMYHVTEDPWEMHNLYHDPHYLAVREEMRRTLFDWTLKTTRYSNTWPHLPQGADGRSSPKEWVTLRDREGPWRLAYL